MTKIIRPIRICGDVAYVPLTHGYEAIIDAADVPLVEVKNWYASVRLNTSYARSNVTNGTERSHVFIHNFLMGNSKGLFVDHIDGDGLNNRRCNMRFATHAQNMRNARIRCDSTTGFKGTNFHKQSGKWMARIRVNDKSNYLGLFTSPEEAHAAYCAASEKYHGEFGRTE